MKTMVLRLGPLVLTLLLLSSIHAEGYTESTYHIKPTPDTPCPAEPCLTLSEYAQGHLFTSDTTLIFLPGNHSLDRDIAITNVTRFVMHGDTTSLITSRIVCKGPHVLTFHNISLLHIHFLQITSCGSVGAVPAVSVVSISQVEILGSVFEDNGLLVIGSMLNCSGTNFSSSLGTGFTLSNSHAELHNSVFSNNSGGGINSTNSTLTLIGTNSFTNNTADFGGGVLAIESSVYITEITTFLNNSVLTSGGGVYLERSTLNCNGTMTFAGNIVSSNNFSTRVIGTGGGISAVYSRISLAGNSTFIENVAMDGGGLYLKHCQINCSGYILFVNNRADGNGGGLLLSSCNGKLEGTSSFISNSAGSGGGMAVFDKSEMKLSKNSMFEKNMAEQYGGGIYIQKSSLHCGLYTRFASNTANIAGGALGLVKGIAKLDGDSWFTNNSATFGGGITALKGSDLTLNGNITTSENQAHQGGGIHVQDSWLSSNGCISFRNNLADSGGGLLSIVSSVRLEGSSTFVSNTARYAGGALYSEYSNVSVEGDGRFIDNSAEFGGGISIGNGGELTLNGNYTFVENLAHHGGGIAVENSSLCIRGLISFMNNVADDGGGVFSDNSSVKMDGDSCFINNSAGSIGGGIILWHGGSLTLNGNYTFAENLAYHGGGIFVQDSRLSSRGHISLMNNVADVSGGGLTSDNSTVSVEGDGRFINNSAEYGGGISIAYGGGLTLIGNYLFAENVAYQGGGIIILNSSLRSRGNINLISNVANDIGAGLYSYNSIVEMEGDGRFINNLARHGGGIAIVDGSDLTLNSSYTFADNLAHQSGGGIVVQNSSLSSRGTVNFINNVADDDGGGVFSEYSVVKVEGDGMFLNNSAEYGGGIAIVKGGDLTLNGSYSFAENLAYYHGGGIAVENSSLSIRGHISFINNVANVSGGGLVSEYSTVRMEGDGMFINNSAEFGGGVATLYGGGLTLNGNSIFAENLAHQGGGCFVQDSRLSTSGHISFMNNIANDSGAGLALGNSSVKMEGEGLFKNNSARSNGGGIAILYENDLALNGKYTLVENSADQGGGIAVTSSSLSCSGHISFINNLSYDSGGGLASGNSSVKLEGNSSFVNNTVFYAGAALYSNYSNVRVEGNSSFIGNTAFYAGGALYSKYSNVRVEGNGRFVMNSARFGGGIHTLRENNLTLNGNNSFLENSADQGGGINMQNSSLSSRGHIIFINNLANSTGGGLVSINSILQLKGSSLNMHSGHVLFINNSAPWGGGFSCIGRTDMSIQTHSMFARNVAKYGGGGGAGVHSGCTVNFNGMSTFTQNTAAYGGSVLVVEGTVRLNGKTDFYNNSAVYGGGIHGSRAILEINETVSFTENTATNGGGLSLAGGSQCLLSSNSTVYLRGNHAEQYGGGIFVADEPFLYCTFRQQSWIVDTREHCFFQPLDLPDPTVHFILENNTAADTGTALYGGMVDRCDIEYQNINLYSGTIFNKTFKYKNSSRELVISSAPFQVCPCYDGHPSCNQSDVTVSAYPGETFSVSLVAVGQRNGIVPSLIQSSFDENGANIAELQYAQSAKSTCTPLHYTVSSTNSSVTMTLLADGPCLDLGEPLHVNIDLKTCPIGFQLSEASKQCICHQRLQKYTNSCDIDDRRIKTNGKVWVGLDKTVDGIILHSHCPFDYCKSQSVRFTLNETDLQCNYDRRGLLCGGCQPDLSLPLGSSHCLQCSNAYLALLGVFAIAGIALVIFILFCKLTVAVGTINGLIFYANVVAVNQSVFFPSGDTNTVLVILRVFIAWLNLDLGIETCFYDGMDAYARTWLQFIFPVYIWVLVFTVIILCYYKTWAVQMFGRNPVAVLATLFLLSYAKLLRTIITALTFTFLEYPDGSEVAVWLYDGNIQYLKGKHIPLFLVSMTVLLLLFLPYTLVLLFGQWMQAHSKIRLFSWINDHRVKAFLDAYHGPFRKEHRYWSGLLLVFRSCLFLLFAFNALGNPNVNLLAIIISTAVLTLLTVFTGRIYVNCYLQGLEASFIMNCLVFAAATLYFRSANKNQAALTYTSVGITLVTFTGMIIYHVTIQLKDSYVWKDIIHPKLQRHRRQWAAVPLEDPVGDVDPDVGPPDSSTCTFIDLRETLLEDSVPDVEDENTVAGSERYIVQCRAQPTQTVVDLRQLIREDPANNVLPMIELH